MSVSVLSDSALNTLAVALYSFIRSMLLERVE